MKLEDLQELDIVYTGNEVFGEYLLWIQTIEFIEDRCDIFAVDEYKDLKIECREVDGIISAEMIVPTTGFCRDNQQVGHYPKSKMDWITFYRKIN